MQVEQFPDREIQVGDNFYRYFGGTAYLGLPTHPQFQEILIKNITAIRKLEIKSA